MTIRIILILLTLGLLASTSAAITWPIVCFVALLIAAGVALEWIK